MQLPDNPETTALTIQGHEFVIPLPFEAGYVLRENDADALNQTFAENIRNNYAKKVSEAKEEAEKAGTALDIAALQADLNAYISDYDFGVRRMGSGPVDPVEREALKIAREKVRTAARKKGAKLSPEQVEEFAKAALEKYPSIREAAKAIIAARQSAAVEALPDLAA